MFHGSCLRHKSNRCIILYTTKMQGKRSFFLSFTHHKLVGHPFLAAKGFRYVQSSLYENTQVKYSLTYYLETMCPWCTCDSLLLQQTHIAAIPCCTPTGWILAIWSCGYTLLTLKYAIIFLWLFVLDFLHSIFSLSFWSQYCIYVLPICNAFSPAYMLPGHIVTEKTEF